jgi:toluene monooxygenase system protein D
VSEEQRPAFGHPARVGPVLEASEPGRAVLAAIRQLNEQVDVVDRGAYLRVLVRGRCVVTREAIEHALGRPFRLPTDLEPLMIAFKGFLRMDEEQVEWKCERS